MLAFISIGQQLGERLPAGGAGHRIFLYLRKNVRPVAVGPVVGLGAFLEGSERVRIAICVSLPLSLSLCGYFFPLIFDLIHK